MNLLKTFSRTIVSVSHYQVGESWLSPNCSTNETCESCANCVTGFTTVTSTSYSCDEGYVCYDGQCLGNISY